MTCAEDLSQNGAPRPAVDWGACLAAHGGWLRQVILGRTGEAQAVEEVWPQVTLAALEQLWPLADPDKAALWLHRVAMAEAQAWLRAQLGLGEGSRLVTTAVPPR
jgi:DNA-directed RNA polymerase specialized sigma24 family protein